MITEDFEQGQIRPPDEADSLLIRTTRGCPWNRCTFCTLYKGIKFSIRSVAEIKKDILTAQKVYNERKVERCFLQDGDSFTMKTHDLVEILHALKEAFPSIKQISSYGRAQTMLRKSPTEIKEIGDAGLNVLYCGMESGSDEVLKKVRKGVTAEALLASSINAKNAGMDILLFTILGLGGKELTQSHADDTARLINLIDPAVVRILSLAVNPGTALDTMVQEGTFTMLSEVEMIKEQQMIVNQLDGIHSKYVNYHAVNLLTELRGQLPQDKINLLSTIGRFMALSYEDQLNFIFGRRRGYYSHLDDMQQRDRYALISIEMNKYQEKYPGQLEAFFHACRRSWI
ncbi:B12-binding domain-containing radical SAM protein [Desulfogranum mediterraneum]|uniref:B12-binding domain-containing radical SAM protein n=1 Tax=Desulfogranum mediterraneum TaxID=160661 RepID=UPI0003FCFCCE|nr:radical SAM protein [Desulfogranum mediterraneum]